jgi:hypothetical protein
MNIDKEVAALQQMTVGQLQDRYATLFGERTHSRHKAYLVRRIMWRMQANQEGDLSDRARKRANELARDADVRVTSPKVVELCRSPKPERTESVAFRDPRLPVLGTEIVRKYKGRVLRVVVRNDGFEYEGERFNSLTAVAKAITGSHCNGFRFFRLREAP